MIWLSRLWVFTKWSVIGLIAIIFTGALILGASMPYALTRSFDAGIEPESADRFVIERVNILTMATPDFAPETVLRERWVVIENGRISAISESDPSPVAGERRIDGAGKTLTPGLIDMHVHVFDQTDLLLYLSYGVTTVRNMMGLEVHKAFRRGLADGDYPGPRLITASPTLNQNSDAPFHKYVEDAEEARELVRQYSAEGYDLIKVYDGLEPDVFYAILDEAKKADMPVAGHLPYSVAFEESIVAGLVSIEHVEEIYNGPLKRFGEDAPSVDEIVATIKASGVPVAPTLAAFRNLALAAEGKEEFVATIDRDLINPIVNFFGDRAMADPLSREDPEPYMRAARYMAEITKALYEADVPLLLSTDTGPSLTISGKATHDEISYLADIGLAPYDILASGTIIAAQVLGLEGEIGIVASGYRADLVLVNGDPLADLSTMRTPAGVFRDGAYFDANALAKMKTRARDNMSFYETLGWFLRHEMVK